jgi:hypothetical protein
VYLAEIKLFPQAFGIILAWQESDIILYFLIHAACGILIQNLLIFLSL